MSYSFSYIGDPDDPEFDWDRITNNNCATHLPKCAVSGARGQFGTIGHIDQFTVMRLISEGQYEGKQLDWGAWAVKMSGQQLYDFFRMRMERARKFESSQAPAVSEPVRSARLALIRDRQDEDGKLLDAIAALDPTKIYLLVGGEGS